MTLILQKIIAITILLAMFMEHIATYTTRIPKMAEKMAEVVKSTISQKPVITNFSRTLKIPTKQQR